MCISCLLIQMLVCGEFCKDWGSAKRLAYQLAIILSSKSGRSVKAVAQKYGLHLTEPEIWKACEDSDSGSE